MRKALAASQLTETDVAAHLGVDPKTVRRWLSGQRPYPRHRWALSELLKASEGELWPDGNPAPQPQGRSIGKGCHVYPHRWEVPEEVWRDLFESADREIGILVYCGLFLADNTGILRIFERKAKSGVNVRILLGDPDSPQVEQRGEEEGIGDALRGKVQNALVLYRPLVEVDGLEVRLHGSVLYNSIYLTEKHLLANHHIHGVSASRSPVLRISRTLLPDMAETYIQSFERIWYEARPFKA
nr:XRE family transcriptional regulator [Nocardiopsis mwathae]